MRKQILLLFALLNFTWASAQKSFSSKDPLYIENVQLGEKAHLAGKMDSCIVYYETAFKIKQKSVLSTLRASACAYGKGDQELLKKYLDRCFDINFGAPKSIFESYSDFAYLQGTPLHDEIINRFTIEAKKRGMNLQLMNELSQIGKSDQEQRRLMRSFEEKYGWESSQMDSLWRIQSLSDSLNMIRIKEIIAEHGYPGNSLVGNESSTAFLVIQHSNQATQEEYLPILEEAANKGELRKSSFALLKDRVLLGMNKKQIYGSQIHRDQESGEFYFGPIEQPFKVDSLRETMGLGPLNDYAKHWDFSFDPQKHLERIKRMEKEAEEKSRMAKEKKED